MLYVGRLQTAHGTRVTHRRASLRSMLRSVLSLTDKIRDVKPNNLILSYLSRMLGSRLDAWFSLRMLGSLVRNFKNSPPGLTQAVLARPRAGITPDITAPTRVGRPAQAAGAPPQPPRYTMMDVKTLSGANELYHEGPHARQHRRGRRCRSGRGG
jgi:hypothetical protein